MLSPKGRFASCSNRLCDGTKTTTKVAEMKRNCYKVFVVGDPLSGTQADRHVLLAAANAEEAAQMIRLLCDMDAKHPESIGRMLIEVDLLVVPKKPTQQMLDAAWASALAEDAAGVWESMIEAGSAEQ
jgi:hypothetical protein